MEWTETRVGMYVVACSNRAAAHADIVTAHIVMAYIVGAHLAMAYIVMACMHRYHSQV